MLAEDIVPSCEEYSYPWFMETDGPRPPSIMRVAQKNGIGSRIDSFVESGIGLANKMISHTVNAFLPIH
jgi:hypothetical protein